MREDGSDSQWTWHYGSWRCSLRHISPITHTYTSEQGQHVLILELGLQDHDVDYKLFFSSIVLYLLSLPSFLQDLQVEGFEDDCAFRTDTIVYDVKTGQKDSEFKQIQ